MVLTASALGVAAHFLNTLPDFDDDAATGIQGLPHRIGATASPRRRDGPARGRLGGRGARPVRVLRPAWAWGALALVVVLAAVALVGRGKAPFYAAIAIALVDVVLLTVVAA